MDQLDELIKDMDPLASTFLIPYNRVPPTEILSKLVVPCMKALKDQHLLKHWTYMISDAIEIHVRISSTHPADQVESSIIRALSEPLSVLGTGISLTPDRQLVKKSKLFERYGALNGLKINRLFHRIDTRLAVDLLEIVPTMTSGEHTLVQRFSDYYFFKDTLLRSTGPAELAAIDRWLEFIEKKIASESDNSKIRISETKNLASKEMGHFLPALSALDSKGWRLATTGPLSKIYSKYMRPFEFIGKCLLKNEPHFSEAFPRSFVFFHSYLHYHYFRLGRAGFEEVFTLNLIREFLRAKFRT